MSRTVNEGFEELIRRLQPLQSEHDKAAKHRASVFSCLEKNFGCTRLAETGSFGYGTGVREYSDTDYFAMCPSKNLWNNSAYTLTKFKDALNATFRSTSDIRVSTPAVRIPFGTKTSETMEITPALFQGLVQTPLGSKGLFAIPSYGGSWMKSSPNAHNSYVLSIDNKLHQKVKPLIQLVKAWKYLNNADIISFYLELRTTKYCEGETYISYAVDFKRVLKSLLDNNLASMQDPMGISGYVPSCKTTLQKETALTKLAGDVERADKALEAEKKGNLDEAFRLWNIVFNNDFPCR